MRSQSLGKSGRGYGTRHTHGPRARCTCIVQCEIILPAIGQEMLSGQLEIIKTLQEHHDCDNASLYQDFNYFMSVVIRSPANHQIDRLGAILLHPVVNVLNELKGINVHKQCSYWSQLRNCPEVLTQCNNTTMQQWGVVHVEYCLVLFNTLLTICAHNDE